MPAEDAEVLHHGTSPEHTAWLHSARAPVYQCMSTRRLRARITVPPFSAHTCVREQSPLGASLSRWPWEVCVTRAHVNKHGPSHVTPRRNLRACQGTRLPPIVPEQWCLGWHRAVTHPWPWHRGDHGQHCARWGIEIRDPDTNNSRAKVAKAPGQEVSGHAPSGGTPCP